VFWVEFEFFSFCFPGCRTCGPFVDAETTNMFFFPEACRNKLWRLKPRLLARGAVSGEHGGSLRLMLRQKLRCECKVSVG
jgi:hypothetical protein